MTGWGCLRKSRLL